MTICLKGSKMEILVTGSSGFIGKSLCRRLMKDGHHVWGLDITKPDIPIDYLILDITHPEIITHPIWEGINHVYHLAAMANLDEARENNHKCLMLNVEGTRNIVECCRKFHIPLTYISTCCVYGATTEHPTTETAPTYPTEIYGQTKLMGELFVKTLPRYTILRYSTVIGPEMRAALATYIFLTQASKKVPFTIHGNGQQTRSWVFIDDLIEATVKSLAVQDNQVFNIAGFESPTVLQVATWAAEVIGVEPKFTFLPDRPGQVFHEEISIEKVKRMLDWEPKNSVKEALRKSWEGMQH